MALEELIYAGHSAVLLKGKNLAVGIDPWLQGNPLCPKDLTSLDRLDLIVLTHGHFDHAGDVLRLAKEYTSKIVATFELAMLLVEEGVPESQVVPMNKGGTVSVSGINVTLTHAIHSSTFNTSKGPRYAGESCGAVVHDGNATIYHAGDTALFSDISLIGRRYRPHIALLPIGDVYTMGPEEAAEAAAMLRPKVAVPVHYGTMDALTGTAEQFVKECALKEIRALKVAPGERLDIREFCKKEVRP